MNTALSRSCASGGALSGTQALEACASTSDGRLLADLVALGVACCDAGRYRAASRQRRRRRALEDDVSLTGLESTTWRPALCRLLVPAHSLGERAPFFGRGSCGALASTCGFARCRERQGGPRSLKQKSASERHIFSFGNRTEMCLERNRPGGQTPSSERVRQRIDTNSLCGPELKLRPWVKKYWVTRGATGTE